MSRFKIPSLMDFADIILKYVDKYWEYWGYVVLGIIIFIIAILWK